MSENASPAPLNPTALPVADAARLLTKIGGATISESMLSADVAAGAPTNADGTISLVSYAAWLAKETGDGG